MNPALPVILVYDIGLTNCKCVIFSMEGEILAQSTIPYPTYQTVEGFVEQDPADWWKAACKATREILTSNPGLLKRISSISITGHMHALVGMDRKGEPLINALVLGDQRSIDSARKLTAEMGLESIYRITGARMEESMPAAKIHWMKTNAPEVFSRISFFTGCKDFVRFCLTGDRLTDPIDACAMSLYDLQTGRWAEELVRLAGITVGHLPEISSPTTQAGKLRGEAAQALGLREGIPVIVGSGDDIEVLGCGLLTPGNAKEHIGTTGSFLSCMTELVYDDLMALEIYPHAETGLWVIGGSITSAGATLSWVANMLGYGEVKDVFSSGFRLNSSKMNDHLLFMPHLSGERCPSWNPFVRGAWLGLSPSHTRDDLLSAAFEGIAQALKSILDRIDALAGNQQQVVVDKRSDSSQEWLQLRANVYGRPLSITSTQEPTALGAMILGAVGVGMYQNIREATLSVTGIDTLIEPEVALQESIDYQSSTYEQAQATLIPIWQSLHRPGIKGEDHLSPNRISR
jgi:xylulokinase